MKALLIVLLILVLLGLLRVGIHLVYDGQVRIRIRIGGLKISLPREKKPRKQTAEKPKPPEQPKVSKSQGKAWDLAALAHWQDILALVGKALHMPKLDPLTVHVTVGGPDPAERALNYGRAWAVLGAVLPVVENTFRIGKRDVGVQWGEGQEPFTFDIETGLTVRIWEVLLLGVLGLKVLIQIYRTKSSEKAVHTL